MKNFEYVEILTKNEVDDFIKFISLKNNSSNSENKYLTKNKKALVKEYNLYENEIINVFTNQLKDYEKELKRWNEKTCVCGKKLKYIDGYKFWGCTDYENNKKEHITFKHNQQEFFDYRFNNIKVRLSAHWCTDIIKKLNLVGKIKAKELLLFYISLNLEDLRKKYGYKSTIKSISAYVIANRESKREELEIQEFLKPHFDKVIHQVYVRYKEKESIEKIKIFDLIVSDKKQVYLIEIKRHNIYIDEEQLELYFELLSHLMKTNNDKRSLKSLFVVNEFYESSYNFNNCIVFEDIKKLKSKAQILKKFDTRIYK
jgi:hypothetical protein